jgi:hypothetical protein
VGSVKRCKNQKCENLVNEHGGTQSEGRPREYCDSCQIIFRDKDKTKKYEQIHERKHVGNKKQDVKILKFLKRKEQNFAELCRLAYDEKDPDAIEKLEKRRKEQDRE